jgi:hypothetical protein
MKRIALVALVCFAIFLVGCSSIPGVGDGSPSAPKTVRKAKLNPRFEMRHVSFEVGPGAQLPILLKLADGDRVDGYFYVESGSGVGFQIMANSQVYKSPEEAAGKGTMSDRFSFAASQAQGGSYTLVFTNPAPATDKQARITIFSEIIYPASDSVFTLLDSK